MSRRVTRVLDLCDEEDDHGWLDVSRIRVPMRMKLGDEHGRLLLRGQDSHSHSESICRQSLVNFRR
jgi:hypothetical protein